MASDGDSAIMILRGIVLAIITCLSFPLQSSKSHAEDSEDGVGVTPHPDLPEVVVSGEEGIIGLTPTTPVIQGDPQQFQTALSMNCSGVEPNDLETMCAAARNCPNPGELSYILWIRELPDGVWIPDDIVCLDADNPEELPQPVVTQALVLREVRRIGLPALQIQVQPTGATLVNFDTIFYTEPEPFARTIQLLRYTVDVEANPSTYGWSFGDGQSATTQGPGAPYPADDVVHSYASADVVEQPSVDVTYEIRFRVDGGEWRSIDETVTADGPTVDVEVKEATPVLSGD